MAKKAIRTMDVVGAGVGIIILGILLGIVIVFLSIGLTFPIWMLVVSIIAGIILFVGIGTVIYAWSQFKKGRNFLYI